MGLERQAAVEMAEMQMSTLLVAFLIFICRVIDQAMGTLRVLYAVGGKKYTAGIIGAVEVSIYVWAISAVVSNIGNIMNFLAYGLGFGTGTVLGVVLERKIAPGNLRISVVTKHLVGPMAVRLRAMGFGATESTGAGKDGQVNIITSVILRRQLPLYLETVHEIDESAFVTSDQIYEVRNGYLTSLKSK